MLFTWACDSIPLFSQCTSSFFRGCPRVCKVHVQLIQVHCPQTLLLHRQLASLVPTSSLLRLCHCQSFHLYVSYPLSKLPTVQQIKSKKNGSFYFPFSHSSLIVFFSLCRPRFLTYIFLYSYCVGLTKRHSGWGLSDFESWTPIKYAVTAYIKYLE